MFKIDFIALFLLSFKGLTLQEFETSEGFAVTSPDFELNFHCDLIHFAL